MATITEQQITRALNEASGSTPIVSPFTPAGENAQGALFFMKQRSSPLDDPEFAKLLREHRELFPARKSRRIISGVVEPLTLFEAITGKVNTSVIHTELMSETSNEHQENPDDDLDVWKDVLASGQTPRIEVTEDVEVSRRRKIIKGLKDRASTSSHMVAALAEKLGPIIEQIPDPSPHNNHLSGEEQVEEEAHSDPMNSGKVNAVTDEDAVDKELRTMLEKDAKRRKNQLKRQKEKERKQKKKLESQLQREAEQTESILHANTTTDNDTVISSEELKASDPERIFVVNLKGRVDINTQELDWKTELFIKARDATGGVMPLVKKITERIPKDVFPAPLTMRQRVTSGALTLIAGASPFAAETVSGANAAKPSARPAGITAQPFDFLIETIPADPPKIEDAMAKLQNLSEAGLRELGRSADKKAFFDVLRPAAEETERQFGVPAAITLAQAAIESAWGERIIPGYNIFGMKLEGPAGSIMLPTKEEVNGVTVIKDAQFAKYHNFLEAVMEHGKKFQKVYYAKAMAQLRVDHDAIAFGYNITGIYASDSRYGDTLKQIITEYNLNVPIAYPVKPGARASGERPIPSPEMQNTTGPAVFPLGTTQEVIINQPIETRWCYKKGDNCHHEYNAIDIQVPTGTPVLASRGGTVIDTKNTVRADTDCDHNYGDTMRIKGDDGLWYYYAHMGEDTRTKKIGDKVATGEVIGLVGTRENGQCTNSHLHTDVSPVLNDFARPGPNADVLIDEQGRMVKLFAELPAK